MHTMIARSFAVALLCLASVHVGGSSHEAIDVQVEAGDHDRLDTAVALDLPASWAGVEALHLTSVDTGQSVPVQLAPGGGRAVWLIREKLSAGQARRYRLAPAVGRPPATVTPVENNDYVALKAGGKEVLRYNKAVIPSPDPDKPHYRRSGHIHPIFDPSGRSVTDDFAPDHRHQHGLMFAWNRTLFEGRKVDFWSQVHATVEHAEMGTVSAGPVFGEFVAELQHVELNAPGGPKPVLNESWRVRVYAISDYFLFDLESTQKTATPEPLEIQEVYYGALAIRGNRNWLDPTNGDYLTSEGKGREGNQTRPYWVDMHGLIDGKVSGITIMDHPGNFRFPQPVRLHGEKPYFCFAPHILGDFTIKPGEPYVSRYRFFVHDGPPDAGQIERLWHDYADPPRVSIVKGS